MTEKENNIWKWESVAIKLTNPKGETVTLNNPNMGGFLPSTGNQDVYNTVWKYELYLYECLIKCSLFISSLYVSKM